MPPFALLPRNPERDFCNCVFANAAVMRLSLAGTTASGQRRPFFGVFLLYAALAQSAEQEGPPVCGELLILGKSVIRHTQAHRQSFGIIVEDHDGGTPEFLEARDLTTGVICSGMQIERTAEIRNQSRPAHKLVAFFDQTEAHSMTTTSRRHRCRRRYSARGTFPDPPLRSPASAHRRGRATELLVRGLCLSLRS